MAPESLNLETLNHYTRALSVALGYRDLMTQLHSERVHGLARAIGSHIGLDTALLDRLEIAAAFHDIGKIGIPDYILLKAGQLDYTEWQIMQQHSEAGENIMAAIDIEGAHEVATIIRHHHEHYDGHGYPDALAGVDIPVCARIISIADSYDAMAVTRAYHHARTHGEIMVVLEEERGTKHDPWLLDRFSELIEHSEFKTRET